MTSTHRSICRHHVPEIFLSVVITFRKSVVFGFAEQNPKHPNFLQIEESPVNQEISRVWGDLFAGKWSALSFAQQN